MKLPILPLFVLVPLAELFLLIQLGRWLGILPTIALVLSTAVIGVSLLKRQGLSVLAEAQASLDRGEMPIQPVADGACLLVAGAFLLTPGLITDTAGFLLLVPAIRRRIAGAVMKKAMASGHVVVSGRHPRDTGAAPGSRDDGDVIEAEYHEVDAGSEAGNGTKPGSPWNRR